QEIRDFLNEAREAEISGSADDFDRLTALEFVRVGADGELSNKEQTLAFIRRSAKSNIQTIEIQNEQIRVYGSDAIVTGLGIATGQDGAGKKFIIRNFCTFVLVKRKGSWQCASVQQTRVDSDATARISFNVPS
ncbi:MAG: nuclear transport factor 2 family protein, partial [Acidobacteriota bacterium]|nr:nuclear transport factor 2 family protein [Acidobacteriota bacterium]